MARPGEESAGAFEYRDKGGLVVTADPEKADDLHEVARDLRDAGVRVDVVPDPTEVEPPTFVLAVGYGFTAQPELAQTLRRRLTSAADGTAAVAVSATQRTSIPGVSAAGETTGVGGAALAETEGRMAGHAVAGARPSGRLLTVRTAAAVLPTVLPGPSPFTMDG